MAKDGPVDTNKYDHSDHPITHAKHEDLHPPSDAKKDDAEEERAARRHPATGSTPLPLEKPGS